MPTVQLTGYDDEFSVEEYNNVRVLDSGWLKCWDVCSADSEPINPTMYPSDRVLEVEGEEDNIYYGDP